MNPRFKDQPLPGMSLPWRAFRLWMAIAAVSLSFAAGSTAQQMRSSIATGAGSWWNSSWEAGDWFADVTAVNPSDYGSGNWFGLRPRLEDYGLKFGGQWRANFLGLVDGGLDRQTAFNEQLRFFAQVDFEKLAGIPGLTGDASVRWRDGPNPNSFIGGSDAFAASGLQGGKNWRFMPVFLTWKSGKLLFGIKDLLTLSGGWSDPYYDFGNDIFANMLVNNAFTKKGLGASGIPYSSSYASWGGYVKIKPVDWYYAQAGLYSAYPEATRTSNHGLDFAGYAQNPGLNGLYFIAETGFTPEFGPGRLSGKYAFGAAWWGVRNTSFNGQTSVGRYDFYWQGDQMLYRQPSPPRKSDIPGANYGQGSAVTEETRSLSDQGLYWFGWLNFAPPGNSLLPFYFQTGMIYKGLIPTRDLDQIILGLAWGNYSQDQVTANEAAGVPAKTYEGVLEGDYRIQVTKWAYFQPFIQYIVRPNGTGLAGNATVIGFSTAINF